MHSVPLDCQPKDPWLRLALQVVRRAVLDSRMPNKRKAETAIAWLKGDCVVWLMALGYTRSRSEYAIQVWLSGLHKSQE
jgi:hypothetical protein